MHALDSAWDALKRDFDAVSSDAIRAARGQMATDLNQVFRRLRQYENEEQWIAALLDGASRFAAQLAIFTYSGSGDDLRLRGKLNLDLPEHEPFPASSAHAFAAAIKSSDPLVAMRTTSEVSPLLSSRDPLARAHLFPIANAGRTVAILFAIQNESLDANGLELVAGMASAVIERRSNLSLHSQIGPAPQLRPAQESGLPTQESRPVPSLPPWSGLSASQRELHRKARRFSRVAVAEMQFARPEACRAGREHNNLYMFLQKEIDKARENYRKQFLTTPAMVDYLHLELVAHAAQGDEQVLGADYPGQLL